MWIKKSDQEIRADKRKYIQQATIIFSIIFSVSFSFMAKFGWVSRYAGYKDAMSWDELISQLPVILGGAVLLSFLFAFFSEKSKRKSFVCDRCETIKHAIASDQCPCGGQFRDQNTIKWVEDV